MPMQSTGEHRPNRQYHNETREYSSHDHHSLQHTYLFVFLLPYDVTPGLGLLLLSRFQDSLQECTAAKKEMESANVAQRVALRIAAEEKEGR